ncbi:MAG: hypothetical protein K2N48_00110 [Muribaculaceae bacterium]|nr:hypothetical protein [Muribaculaceae bacterium]
MIDITGLDKAELLLELWNGSHAQSMSFFGQFTTQPSIDDARSFLESANYYADYFNGRVIKVDFRGDKVDGRLYDRNYGQGACERIIMNLKKKKGLV